MGLDEYKKRLGERIKTEEKGKFDISYHSILHYIYTWISDFQVPPTGQSKYFLTTTKALHGTPPINYFSAGNSLLRWLRRFLSSEELATSVNSSYKPAPKLVILHMHWSAGLRSKAPPRIESSIISKA